MSADNPTCPAAASPEGKPAATPVLVVGEALIDIVRTRAGEVVEHVGGSPANVAVGLARLGHDATLATHLARDRHGEMITTHLREQGVHLVGEPSAPSTPTAAATLDDQGGATYDFDLTWDVPSGVDVADFGHLHIGSIGAILQPGAAAVLALAERARRTGTVSYDPNARPTLMGEPAEVRAQVEQLVGLADVVKASDEDLEWLYAGAPVEEVLQLWGRLGPSLLVVTRGGEGALVSVPGGDEHAEVPAPAVEVVDTVGAGDSFMAGLLSALLDADLLGAVDGVEVDSRGARERLRRARSAGLRPAVDRALACAAITVSRAGANPPRREELADAVDRSAARR
ncbi:MAG TPA: carbohydrate kinase [Segeticoccus sp.]|uniref:carbohydrate kinase family protein n=1 Tax=Segeticoccus sp. TaxID=2706531 RepID=UPI002D7E67B4|nr:carbohydrate kinase [Segeticoccus sp.]HET8599219.1 carbohydrate kinase [Segeticoccus sp.]